MVDGVGGRGVMKAEGVFGGSMFGMVDLQDSTNLASTGVSAGTLVENGRRHLMAEEVALESNRGACRSIFSLSRVFGTDLSLGSGGELKNGREAKKMKNQLTVCGDC